MNVSFQSAFICSICPTSLIGCHIYPTEMFFSSRLSNYMLKYVPLILHSYPSSKTLQSFIVSPSYTRTWKLFNQSIRTPFVEEDKKKKSDFGRVFRYIEHLTFLFEVIFLFSSLHLWFPRVRDHAGHLLRSTPITRTSIQSICPSHFM